LTWGASPKDLDATAIVRKAGQKDDKIYWRNRKAKNGLVTLDVDNTKGFGPETQTLTNDLDESTTVAYFVHNYSKTPSITKSGAKVVVYNYDHEVAHFNVPTHGNGQYWHVFDFTKKGLVKRVDKIVGNTKHVNK